MRFDLVSIFPEFFTGPLEHGIVRKAREAELIEIHVQDLRVFTKDRHRTVDDRPFGGGEGMVLKPEPLFEAVEFLLGSSMGDAAAKRELDSNTAIVLLSAAGKRFTQETARRYAQLERIVFICGRYEGVDERVAEHLATEEVSIGDFVLSGGELPAALILDAITRLLPGALGNEASSQNESFSRSGRVKADSSVAGAQPRAGCRPVAGFSALHAAGGFSRMDGPRGADRRQSRRSREMAARTGACENTTQPAGPWER
jgi:tRNA (guanine37-N1)-methyltransferase